MPLEQGQGEREPCTNATLYGQLFRCMPLGFALRELVTDEQGNPRDFRFVEVNPAFQAFCGMPPETVIGRICSELRSDHRPPEPHFGIFLRVALTGEPADFEYHVPSTDRYFHIHVYSLRRGLVATLVFDTTERRRAEENLKKREKLFRLLTEHAIDVVYRYSVEPSLTLEYVSPAVLRMTGYTPEELSSLDNRGLLSIVHPDDESAWRVVLQGTLARPVTTTLRFIRKDGSVIWTEHNITPILDPSGAVTAVEAIARDVTERKQLEETLKYLSLHDSITGLYNRAFFEEEINRLDGGRDYPITILSTDVDGLKTVNDTRGHQKGDELLKAYAGVLRQTFRKADVVARVGGDEFAVILPRTDGAVADQFAQRLQDALNNYNKSGTDIPLSVSIGAATALNPACTLQELFNKADRIMYRNKAARSSPHRVSPAYLE